MSDVNPQNAIDLGRGCWLMYHRITWRFDRSSGPGGQNVNKVNSKATLIVPMWAISEVLPAIVVSRLRQIGARWINDADELIVYSMATRSQHDNRSDCERKLRDLVEAARRRPKKRKPTRPSRGSIERRLNAKRQTGAKKSRRGRNWRAEDW